MMISTADRQILLKRLVTVWGDYLQPLVPFANAKLLLAAVAEVESTFGSNTRPRYEKNYDFGGSYWTAENAQKWGWNEYGPIVCCSYSSFQIMYPTALELGLPSSQDPMCLNHDDIAINYVVKYIKERALDKGAKTIEDIADTYNSGSFKDKIVPTAYIKKFVEAYKSVQVTRGIDIS